MTHFLITLQCPLLFQQEAHPPTGTLEIVAIVLTALLTLVLVFLTALLVLPIVKQWALERALNKKFGADFYPAAVISNSTRYYVRPECSKVDISGRIEERNLIQPKMDLFETVDSFCSDDSPHRHMLLLADSGMGKSSFLLNYYGFNRNRRASKRYRIAVIPLGHPETDNGIRLLENKNETILFLDAFDEDLEAVKDYRYRLEVLMKETSLFKRVLITCRTQFFPKDDEIPSQTGIVKFGPRQHGEQAVYEFVKRYLAPFSDRQVDEFLRLRYPFWRLDLREKARTVIGRIPLLSVRPLLLAYIPDVLEGASRIEFSYQLYELMVEKWYQREVGWWESEEHIRQFSEEAAVQLYLRFLSSGADRLSRDEIHQLTNSMQIPIDTWKTTSRSLLNRDSVGNFKFAHRSIMEYLFVKRFIAGESRCRVTRWTDQMKRFLIEMIKLLHQTKSLSVELSGADLEEVVLRNTSIPGLRLPQTNFRRTNMISSDFENADFRESNFERASLYKVRLEGANLSRSALQNSDMRFASLVKADLQGVNLHGADLAWIDLREAVLKDANMQECDLNEGNLRNADLENANLRGAKLYGAQFQQAHLRGADLQDVSGGQFGNHHRTSFAHADLHRANLENAALRGADFESAKLGGAKLKKADLDGANLRDADLGGATLQQAILNGANLHAANLKLANLHNAKLNKAHLAGADLTNANLGGASLNNSTLEAVNLEGAKLIKTSLHQANLKGARLTKSHLDGVKLVGADLVDLDLEGAKLEATNLERADLRRANLQHATLLRTNLREAKLYSANLRNTEFTKVDCWKAELYGADLRESKLSGISLRNASLRDVKAQDAIFVGTDLEEADLTGANLQRADLTNANLRKATGVNANCKNANLTSADLRNANLPYADFSGAILDKARLQGADLSRSKIDWGQIASAFIDINTAVPPEFQLQKKARLELE